jgi:large subunit ribosomal protein L25
VVYGAGKDAVAVTVSPKDIATIVHSSTGYNTIFNLQIGGAETTPVMIVDQQHDPVKGALLHTDFQRIDLGKKIHVSVPVFTHGDAKGVKTQGGLFELVTRTVEIECLPDDIPEHFDVDVTELLLGQNMRASDIRMAPSIRLLSPADAVVAHVIPARGLPAETPAAEAAPPAVAEPEVIKKGKKEEEAPKKK